METNDIKAIVTALQESVWDHAVVSVGDARIEVSRNGYHGPQVSALAEASPVRAAVPVAIGAAADQPTASSGPILESTSELNGALRSAAPAKPGGAPVVGHTIHSPSVGVLWRCPAPGEEPFVKEGDHVNTGDTLCIVEIMKLMSNVAADVTGTIAAVHVENGVDVEHGTPLFTIVPDED